jgi:hypothetical protein
MQYKLPTAKGYSPQAFQSVVDDINGIFVQVFGTKWNQDSTSPNGQFVSQLANIAINNQNFFTYLYQIWNPNTSSGVFLDDLCALLNIYRKGASPSSILFRCYGTNGTIIPAGSQIFDITANVYLSSGQDTTINTLDTTLNQYYADITFSSTTAGAIVLTYNDSINIVTYISGWNSAVTPPIANQNINIGNNIQSDASLKAQRVLLLAKSGSGWIDSLYANLYEIEGVTAVWVDQNDSQVAVKSSGNIAPLSSNQPPQIIPTSVWVCVSSDASLTTYQAIAEQMFNKRPPGISMNQVTDRTAYSLPALTNQTVLYQYPLPQGGSYPFTAYFTEANQVPITVSVTIYQNLATSTITVAQIQTAIFNNFYGNDLNWATTRPGIGEIINAQRFVPSLIVLGVPFIKSISVSLVNPPSPLQAISNVPELSLPTNYIATLINNSTYIQVTIVATP